MKEDWITGSLFGDPRTVKDLKIQATIQGWILSSSVLSIVGLVLHGNYGGLLLLNVLLAAYAMTKRKQLIVWAEKVDQEIKALVELIDTLELGTVENLGEKPSEKGE